MNRIVDEIETIAGDGNGQIYFDKFTTLMRKWVTVVKNYICIVCVLFNCVLNIHIFFCSLFMDPLIFVEQQDVRTQ